MIKEIEFNPIQNKQPRGASVEREKVSFSLRLLHSVLAGKVNFVFIEENSGQTYSFPMKKTCEDENYSTYEISTEFKKGINWYHFEIEKASEKLFVCQGDFLNAELKTSLTFSFAQIVTKQQSDVKQKGIIYHVFVDRFCKGENVKARKDFVEREDWGGKITKNTKDPVKLNREVFCGDLYGVISKLDYIKSLGVTLIYLSPIFMSNSYHKYDTADYMQVDPMFGGDVALQKLILEAKKRGIGILLDGVFNHAGSDSVYFNKDKHFDEIGAYNSKSSKYFDWFTFNSWPNDYKAWWGVPTLPTLNGKSETYNNFITGKNGVLEKWLSLGVAGFRLDVVDELEQTFLENVSKKIREFDDKIIIGEVWEDASIKIAYGLRRKYFENDEIDSVMNYPLKNGILSYIQTGDESEFKRNVQMLLDHYPEKALSCLMNVIGTHDSERIRTVINRITDDKEKQFKLFQIATILQYSFLGFPTIFYGDERGVVGGEAPLCRVCFPWDKVDTAEEKWYKKLGQICNNKVLQGGKYNLLFAENGVCVVERKLGNEKFLFVTNLSQDFFEVNFDKAKDVLSNKNISYSKTIEPFGVAILKIKEKK